MLKTKTKRETYTAESMNEALLKVKMDLGDRAEIVETRKVKKGGFFGFLGQTVVEVEAYLPEQSSGSRQKKTTTNHRSNGRGSKNGPLRRESNGTSKRRSGSNGKAKKSKSRSGGFERQVDEQTIPDFSPEDHAADLIKQKNQESESNSGTYDKPTNRLTEKKSSPKSSVSENIDDTDSVSRQKLKKLVDNTDLLAEKIDSLTDSLSDETSSKNGNHPDYPGELSTAYRQLVEEGVEKKLARDLIGRVRRELEPDELDRLTEINDRLRRIISEDVGRPEPLESGDDDSPLLLPFIGPTGVGKTTTMAKLAAHFSVEEGQNVSFITFDTYRLAAVEQLQCYADILQVPIKDVMNKEEFHEAVEDLRAESDLVFIDTAGRSQFDTEKITELERMFEDRYTIQKHLVVEVTSRSSDIDSVLDGFGQIGFDRLVVTKLDETTNHGTLYNLSQRTDKPIAYLTDGQDVPDDLKMMDPEEIAELVIADGDASESEG